MDEEHDFPDEMTDTGSTLVKSANYKPGMEELTVTLTDKTYVYVGVPATVWVEFLTARSKGAYFNRYIRTMYQGVVVGEP